MAALSCYQPCRPHLAQPARCYDESSIEPQSLSLRRRQFIERCHETRVRPRDPIPTEPRHARQEYPPDSRQSRVELGIPDNARRVELGKLDNARRVELGKPDNARRVELGIPDNSLGIPDKSRSNVVERRENGGELSARRRLNVESGWTKVEEVRRKFEGAAANAGYSRSFESPPRRRLADSIFASFKLPRWKEAMSGPRSLAAPAQPKRKSAVELLAETKAFYVKSETVLDRKQELPLRVGSGLSQAIAAGGCHVISSGTLPTDVCCNPYATTRAPRRRSGCGGGGAGARGAGEGLQGALRRLLDDDRGRRPRASCVRSWEECEQEAQPYSLANIPSPVSSDDRDAAPLHVGAISPPAQYRHEPRYTRSNSQSAARASVPPNINSHKSLPDLHSHANHAEQVPGANSAGRSPRRRPSAQRTASSSSRGTRSNHSSMISSSEAFSEHPSPNEDNYHYNSLRSGGGFARDSGGSSGHYTQRTTDRHTHNDSDWVGGVLAVSAPAQFQDGAAPAPAALATQPPLAVHPPPPVSIHFQASAPPPQFQDDPVFDKHEYNRHYRDYHRYHEGEVISKQPAYARPRPDDVTDYTHKQRLASPEEMTSPLGTFKRQRGLRYKQRRPRPILRSKSDISDRYRRTEGRSPASAPCEDDSLDSLSESSDKLDAFFSRLGLDSRQYDAVMSEGREETPVFFSSSSSVDSNQLHDYTVQGPPQQQIYRNTEPPSVVERNARIVKWLCQCRKLQQTPH